MYERLNFTLNTVFSHYIFLVSNRGRLVTMNKEKAIVFHDFLPQSSMVILHAHSLFMGQKLRTGSNVPATESGLWVYGSQLDAF